MKKTRRNPDILGDVFVIGAMVAGVSFLLPALKNLNVGAAADQAQYSIRAPGVNALGGYATPPGVTPDQAVCQAIQTWRANNVPTGTLLFGLLPSGGQDPNDWGAFRAWAQYASDIGDPGPNPPACF